jgi:glycosidase
MAKSIWSPKLHEAFRQTHARSAAHTQSQLPGAMRRVATRGLAAPAAEGPAPFPSPTDWREVWIYQIVLDRFNNPDHPPATAWDHVSSNFQGGTFEGVRRQLDYLRDMGVGALWLSPVLKNCQYWPDTYHGYGIQDFVEVDPRFASDPARAKQDPAFAERELRALVDDAHAHGMYVIFDIVLNHVGDVFTYPAADGGNACDHSAAPYRGDPYTIQWRDEHGCGRPAWTDFPPAEGLSPDAAVWPVEFQRNSYFRRQGKGDESGGDFESLKQMLTDEQETSPQDGLHYPVRNALIRAYQYAIARYDADGFRIDTLKYISPDFALTFGNAMREYGYSIGKYNFFTFGEVYDNEEKINRFIGRNVSLNTDMIGVDAALDFPLFFRLPAVAKGLLPPSEVIGVFEHRKQVERDLLTSHGEAGSFFVTFLDNHDQHNRFYYSDPADPHHYDAQLTLGLGCLFGLQGIPCVYYGTEQGLHGTVELQNWDFSRGDPPLEAVREALWGKDYPNGPSVAHPFYRAVQALAALRKSQPALRYGRQYFRPLSGNGRDFGVSTFTQGVLAFSRILNDHEVLVAANTGGAPWAGEVIVDYALNRAGVAYELLYSNCQDAAAVAVPQAQVIEHGAGSVTIHEVNGGIGTGPIRTVPVRLSPMEVQFLKRVRDEGERVG